MLQAPHASPPGHELGHVADEARDRGRALRVGQRAQRDGVAARQRGRVVAAEVNVLDGHAGLERMPDSRLGDPRHHLRQRPAELARLVRPQHLAPRGVGARHTQLGVQHEHTHRHVLDDSVQRGRLEPARAPRRRLHWCMHPIPPGS
jgi:hypothetical protein